MKKLLVICGATASGKTSLAVKCAKRLNGEVISCDALLVYRGLNIGTAKPTREEMGGIPHHLIDVADPTDGFTVHDFERLALDAVADISARGKVPVLCGGTGFYLNAVLFQSGFGNAAADEGVRAKYNAIAAEKGKEYLHGLLQEVDAESAAVLHPNDVKRVVRALEIYELTGKKKSDQQDGRVPRFPYEAFAFDYPREVLYERIDRRAAQMFEEGLVEEVRGLLASVPENAQCMQAIGYKEVVEGLKNGDNQSTMRDIVQKNTRNYAKRQLTFFKKLPNLHWLTPSDAAVEEVIKIYDR
ncbi:MAG TPA: tRNA (adenosine(37)-N6)-dimethylallyltransferase MiaA [Firmicutes bacterium]|nr:tRNA (adenosine(37)-N6)-dimethylallyltransferase MiaA [Bacillota bacterium]